MQDFLDKSESEQWWVALLILVSIQLTKVQIKAKVNQAVMLQSYFPHGAAAVP